MKLIALGLLCLLQSAVPAFAQPARQAARQACRQDGQTLCPRQHGRRLLTCLRDNRAQLSPQCGAVMDQLTTLTRNEDDRVAVGHSVDVPADESADSVVAVFGEWRWFWDSSFWRFFRTPE